MGMMDNMKDKVMDEGRDKFEDLKQKERDGQLDDKGKAELQKLRNKFEHKAG